MSEPDTKHAAFPQVVREPKLADQVADAILNSILARRLKPGDRLGERELGEQFGVSRTVIREAVRSLAARGVLDAGTGRGLRVTAVDASDVAKSLGLYLRSGARGDIDYSKVHEIRTTLETDMAALAAERVTASDVMRLEAVQREMELLVENGEIAQAAAKDVEFHQVIADLTKNELYRVLLDAIGDALFEVRWTNLSAGRAPEAVASHREICACIARGDAAAARAAMRAHLDVVASLWSELQNRTAALDAGTGSAT
jgi:GntR family transcriptional regulator, transcriptional repressor for pyruvate dehydrogenase complex